VAVYCESHVTDFKKMLRMPNAQCSEANSRRSVCSRLYWKGLIGENGDGTFENRAFREIFGPKAEEMRGEWKQW
jgi:PAS domain-containing protein